MTHFGLPAGPMQAAHFLPGQLRIGGKEVWLFAKNRGTAAQVEFLFAEVEHLPTPFNQADTAAEAKGRSGGLCAALVHACTSLIQHKTTKRPAAGKVSLELLQTGWIAWQRDALVALRNASASKELRPGIPPLVGDPFEGYTLESISARSTAAKSQWNRDDVLRILEYYFEDQRERTWDWVTAGGQTALREVESKFSR
jgi:hypothetical protein